MVDRNRAPPRIPPRPNTTPQHFGGRQIVRQGQGVRKYTINDISGLIQMTSKR